MWLERSIGIWQETVGLREMKGVMTMCRKLCSVKMKITNYWSQETRIGDHYQERQELSNHGSGKIPEDGPGREKRNMRKLKNIKIFRRSSKTVGCKDDCDSGDNGH